ncbi:hypothetical protein L195_g036033 [Trifolium pratense]|uniref:Uncharacterized protein n=1 Tax=Trifolium pratense TaxID=57577 RepID=A0A2K3LND0_TRIPR|nr:hypothetical protein L195_g036033 [Trifolium pratense]
MFIVAPKPGTRFPKVSFLVGFQLPTQPGKQVLHSTLTLCIPDVQVDSRSELFQQLHNCSSYIDGTKS